MEVLVAPGKFEGIVAFISRLVHGEAPITVSAETVEVFRPDHY